MTQEDRRRIDHLLAAGRTINDIAADLGRNRSTILREIIARVVPCDRGYGCSNTLCAKFQTCTRTKGRPDALRRVRGALRRGRSARPQETWHPADRTQ